MVASFLDYSTFVLGILKLSELLSQKNPIVELANSKIAKVSLKPFSS